MRQCETVPKITHGPLRQYLTLREPGRETLVGHSSVSALVWSGDDPELWFYGDRPLRGDIWIIILLIRLARGLDSPPPPRPRTNPDPTTRARSRPSLLMVDAGVRLALPSL